MLIVKTVLFFDLEIEAQCKKVYGIPGDRYTQGTKDFWDLTGLYSCNGINISKEIEQLDSKLKGVITDDFFNQINP